MEQKFAERMRAAFAAGVPSTTGAANPAARGKLPGDSLRADNWTRIEGRRSRLLDTEDGSVRPLGGGTALMLMMKAGVFCLDPPGASSLRKLKTLASHCSQRPTVASLIGALTPLGAVERSVEVGVAGRRRRAHDAAPSPMSACAMSRRSAAISPMAIRTWTCRRC